MNALSWVSSFLYATVLAAGLYGAATTQTSPARTAAFVTVIAVLALLDQAERRLPVSSAVALLALRAALYALATALDTSDTARILFLLVPFLAYFVLGRAASYTLAALLLAGVVLSMPPAWYEDREQVTDLLMLGVGLAFAVAMAAVAAREDTARSRAESLLTDLAASHRQLREYASQAATLATVAERTRVARDIHDSLGHHLTVISVQLEKAAAYRPLDPEAADQALKDAHTSARQALEDVRNSVGALRQSFSLSEALTTLTTRLNDPNFAITLNITGNEENFPTPTLLALYHATQESLTNARRHAAATEVTIEATLNPKNATLKITDNGQGFDPTKKPPGHGLTGMQERLTLINGKVTITSTRGQGTQITATAPGAQN